jgi:hypothetical protein
MGAFHGIANLTDIAWVNPPPNQGEKQTVLHLGIRTCPNMSCRQVVVHVKNDKGEHVLYPPEVVDFDATNLPPRILASLEEAIKCHAAGCYRAAALMVRRVLEELCEDKGAKGDNLMKRLAALSSAIVVPAGLLSAADELRLLGNDAAHIEAKTYDMIGVNECEIAIALAKELLKAVYQYTDLVAKLQALKKQPTA